jgi:hypothetical protein
MGLVWQGAKVGLLVGTSIFCLMLLNPVAQGAMSVNLEIWDITKEEAQIFDHEILPCCLWLPHLAFMVAARCDHVVRWVVWQASYHFPSKIHFLGCDHFSCAGDGVKHVLYLVVAQALFL